MISRITGNGVPDAILGNEAVSIRGTTWQAVLNEILQRIRTHRYPAGELIPTELQLASELGCARATVNRAMTELADRGVVIRRRKVGTRVAEYAADTLAPMSHTLRRRVEHSGRAYRHELLSRQPARATADVAENLMLPLDSDVIETQALIWADDTRWAHEHCWLRQSVAETIPAKAMRSIGAYEWLMANLQPDRVEALIKATDAHTIGSAEAMDLPPQAPLLVISTVLWRGPDPVAYVTHSLDSAFHLES